MKKPVEVTRWNADANDASLEGYTPTDGPMAGKLRVRLGHVNVHIDMRMTPEAYEEFRNMMQRNFGARPPGKPAPKPLPPASPKLPAHDVIDAEFAEVGEDDVG